MPRDWGWYLTLAVIGVVVGSLASFGFRGGLMRNIVIGVFVVLGLGLVLDASGVELPFEAWLKGLLYDTLGAMGRFFGQIVRT
ncbi:MAG TPA: hypothetical protein VG757_00955 [Devosia sp.]|nr:hypothetical protein [Devosia sp.]